jgi:AcrR family transcriptional regulator
VKDIAAEAGVERTTVYRRVGSMDEVFRLLIAREIHLLIATIPAPAPGDAEGPDIVVELLASAVEQWSAHPLIIKVMTDEPDLATRFLTGAIPEAIRRIGVTLEPGLAAAMDLGLIARRDPIVLGEWLARIGISLLVAPSPGDLRTFLHEILDPALRVVTTEPVGLQ